MQGNMQSYFWLKIAFSLTSSLTLYEYLTILKLFVELKQKAQTLNVTNELFVCSVYLDSIFNIRK